jgi:hypothetical protein
MNATTRVPPPVVVGDVQIVSVDDLIFPEPRLRAIVNVVTAPTAIAHFATSLRAWTDRGVW